MSVDSDVALFGTGLAPLVAASRLLAEGRSVLLLNPDWDFFSENSELPLDPLWPLPSGAALARRLAQSSPVSALEILRPDFPGAIESWPRNPSEEKGYHDAFAPHVRSRSRLWLKSQGGEDHDALDLDRIYLETTDAGLHPQFVDGLGAIRRFPGASSRVQSDQLVESLKGLHVARVTDVDVSRYQCGMLEFVRERATSERVLRGVSQLEITSDGIRFYAGGTPRTAKVRESLLVFWTPRMTSWIQGLAKKGAPKLPQPRGVRLWEEWGMVSKDPLDPSFIGTFQGMSVWADAEGTPNPEAPSLHRLSVLRAGPLIGTGIDPTLGMPWASTESFRAVSALCHDFLKWERISIRSMRPRAILEWDDAVEETLAWWQEGPGFKIGVVPRSDGPALDVVKRARRAWSQ